MFNNRQIAEQKGRLIYVEPTNFAQYKIEERGNVSNGVILDNISWNQEDLQFNVDLRVINPDRRGSKLPIYTGKKNTSESNFASFMSGRDLGEDSNFLTDSYTDITFQEFNTNGESQKEALGIDSIDISFDSHFFPLVNIKFTDVRAAALFGPTDNEYVHNKRIEAIQNNKDLSDEQKEEGISKEKNKMSSSFFKSLFHFPYPRFMLSVMGYYGDRVTFQLAVKDFKSSFNSTNGNFDVNVSFIGYMYGLYTDLPMSLIFTAPYYDPDYWKEQTQESYGRFKYTDNQPILTFIDYLKAYYELRKENSDDGLDNSEILNEYNRLYSTKNALEDILNAFEIFDAQFTKSTKEFKVYPPYDKKENKAFILCSNTLRHSLIKSKYDNLYNAVSTYNDKYAEENNRISLKIFSDKGLNNEYIDFNLEFKNEKISETKIEDVDKVIKELNDAQREIPGIKSLGLNQNNESRYFYINSNFFSYYRGDFYTDIKKRIDSAKEALNSKQKAADEEMLRIIEKKLKFKPTIENVFRMVFAHIDTFIHALKSTALNNISTSIATGDGKRRADYLGLTNKNSDLPKNCTGETTVPPFPLCKDEENGEYQYPGVFFTRITDNINNIDEVKFVEKIVNGIEVFIDEAEKAEKLIESLSEKEDKSFVPSSPTDIFYNGINPYLLLKEKLKTVSDDNEVAAHIEYFIFARIIMYAISDGLNNESLKKKIPDLVNLEFSNFEKVGININKNTKAFLINGVQYRMNNKIFTYSNDGKNKNGDLKFNSNLCYFFKNAFDKDDLENKFATNNNKTFLELEEDYQEAISEFEDKYSDFINSEKSAKSREKIKFNKEYTMSYITLSGESKSNIGFGNEYNNWRLLDMHNDFLKDGNNGLNKYGAGILQIGDKRTYYIDKGGANREYKNNKVDDIYLGVNLTEYEKRAVKDSIENNPVMSEQKNLYFKAFLLLGSLSTYFGQCEELISISNNAKIFKFPKALYLYYGACIFFRRKENKNFNNEGINKKPLSLSNLKNYIIDKDSNLDDIVYNIGLNTYIVRTFTNRKTHLFLGEGKSDDCFSFTISDVELNDIERYFINWAESNEFRTIDEMLGANIDNFIDNCEFKTKNDSHKTYFISRKTSSEQDQIIKRLLCEDLYIYKRPNKDLQLVKEYSYSKEYIDSIKKSFEAYKTEEDMKEEERKDEDRRKRTVDLAEIKKALYYTLKRLYDKWLCCYNLNKSPKVEDVFMLNTPSQDKLDRELRYTTNSDDNISTEFNSFIFVDSFYRDISDKFFVDPDTLKQLAESYSNAEIMNSNASVFEFMNEIAEKNGLLFASLPVYSNFYDANTIVDIFSPNKKYDVARSGKSDVPGNTYVIMYTGEASSKLDFGKDGEYDDDGITGIPDIFQSHEDQLETSPSDLKQLIKEADGDEINFVVPVFAVTFGKQNQMYFKNVTVNMDNPKVTDYSIANLIQISQGGKHGDSDGYDVGIGQDLYSIYANRSYNCTVEMLGCINIMPMMYFQLNNIPMFRGLYIIINVSHSITPGNMTTKFTGVRVSKNHIGLVKTVFAYQGQSDKNNEVPDNKKNNENKKEDKKEKDKDCGSCEKVDLSKYNTQLKEYDGPVDGKIGYKLFPQGGGKSKVSPTEDYYPFYVFGIGGSPKSKKPGAKVYPKMSGVECCKLIIKLITESYTKAGCKTIGDIICRYHTGQKTFDDFLKYYSERDCIHDVADGRVVCSTEMIERQLYYQDHLVKYCHMSRNTPIAKTRAVLYPLITFISRQEQAKNTEEACDLALKELKIT